MSRLLLVALLAALAPAALGQTCTTSWTNPAGGAWETAENWSDGVPDASDTACITLAGTYTVAQSRSDRTVAGLVVGGASGTQTLTSFNAFSVSGDAVVRPTGVWEVLNRTPGGGDGVYTTGTITVEGTLVQNGGTSFLTTGGVLDVAPGGVFRLLTNAGAGGADATFRIRGLLEAAGCPTSPASGSCTVAAPLDVQGGTVRAAVGYFDVSGGGALHNATVDASAGAILSFRRPGTFTVTGALAGAPVGRIGVQDAVFRAGPGDATLALGGTGLVFDGSSGSQFSTITSAGGRFINTGLLTWEDQFAIATLVVVENRGMLRSLEGVSLDQGARLLNRAGATWEIATSTALGFGTGTVENAGLIVKTGAGFTNFGGRLRNLPGAELRAVNGRLDFAAPSSQSLPDGVTVTGTAGVLFPGALEIEGAVSPGTPDQPVATLAVTTSYRVSLVAGSPRLVVDLDAGGASDRLAIAVGSGTANTPRLGGALVVRVRPGFTPAVGDQWTVLTSTRAVLGQFTQVVGENAPAGVAFVAETAADGLSVVVRAVETAPGGPITVSTTTPVGGGVRSVFLTGPGAVGITGARLQCTDCLDAEDYGTIPATLVGGVTLVEARFDLTSPRAFGLYDLVIQRPGLTDDVVPVTVRPYVSYVRSLPTLVRGMRVRPPGTGYNWSHYALTNATNTPEPAYPFSLVVPEDGGTVAFAIATGTPFSSGVVFYESEDAPDPAAPAFLFSRVAAGQTAPLAVGQRVAPEDVLFPEQTPTGPDDPRLRFGAERVLSVVSLQHVSFGRAAETIALALRNTPSAALDAYVASVDVADAGALAVAIADVLATRPRYVAGIPDLLARVIERTNATVPAPPGLAAAAAADFQRTLELAAWRLYADVEYAYRIDLATASAPVRALLQAEYDALIAASQAQSRRSPLGNVCRALQNVGQTTPQGPPPPPAEPEIDHRVQCLVQSAIATPRPIDIDITNIPFPNNPMQNIVRTVGNVTRQVITAVENPAPFGGAFGAFAGGAFGGGSCSPGGGGGGGGGAGGAGACGPPQAPADPNDKITETTLRCEFGTVIVDGEPQTRCVRYFVPLARAADPIRYSIQFENLPEATANAEFVTVTDTLDVDLNPATLRVLATSSDSTFSYSVSGSVVTFRFVGIDLPPNVEAPEGQGYLTFEVTPDAGLPEGTVIENRASIVFDFNPPIATPTVTHEIRASSDLAVVLDAPEQVLVGQPAAFRVLVTNIDGDDASDVTVTIDAGAPVTATPSAGTCTGAGPVTCTIPTVSGSTVEEIALVMGTPPPGGYTLSASVASAAFDPFAANDTDEASLAIVLVDGEGGPDGLTEPALAAPRPNPARGVVALRVGLPAPGRADVRVFDLLGREVAVVADGAGMDAGWTEMAWDASRIASGVYVVRFVTEWGGRTEVRTRRLVVVR